MSTEQLLTQEVGSLGKPDWRVAAVAGQEVTDAHIADALVWADRLGLDRDEVDFTFTQIREHAGCPDPESQDWAKNSARYLAARFAVRLQEKAGLDIVYDGEQDRSEMYQHAAARTSGFEWLGPVRVFDDKWYRKAVCVDEVGIVEPWHTDEVARLQGLTDRRIKVPITGAYTLAAWSDDRHYGNRQQLVHDLAVNVIRPNIVSLLDQGVEWIQIDEPAATTIPEEVSLFVDSFNESTKGLDTTFSTHICFPSDYGALFPEVARLENCSQFDLEFANHDSQLLGTRAEDRGAYEILEQIRRYCPDAGVGVGVVSIHEDWLEDPLLVRDRVLRAVDLLGDPVKVFPSPDCGLRTRSWEVAYEKLARTVAGTQLARQELGL